MGLIDDWQERRTFRRFLQDQNGLAPYQQMARWRRRFFWLLALAILAELVTIRVLTR